MQPHNGSNNSHGLQIMIPCPPEKLGEFMADLLGKPQVFSGMFRGTLDISLEDIENFFHLVDQRIKEQNVASLVSFSAEIRFNDGTSFELPSLQHLRAYVEVKPVVSIGVSLTFIYLVMFQGRDTPEKQQIDVEIITKNSLFSSDWAEGPSDILFLPRFSYSSGLDYSGVVTFRVAHTARSWGGDIENLLRSHIKNLFLKETTRYRDFFRKRKFWVSNILSLLICSFFLRLAYLLLTNAHNPVTFGYDKTNDPSSDKISQAISKIDFMFSTITGVDQTLISLATAATVIGVFLISYIFSDKIIDLIKEPRPSFVVLTRKAKEYKERTIKRYDQNWLTFAIAFCVSVLAGVGGNIVTSMIYK